MGRAWWEDLRVDQFFPGPDAAQRVEAVGQGLAEHDHVRLHVEVLDRPQLAGAVEAHLDFVGHHQDAVLVQHLLEFAVEVHRRDHVAAGALDRLDVKRGVFALADFRVPHAVVFGLEQAGELLHAVAAVLFLGHAFRAAEVVRERDELRALAEVAVAATVAVAGGDRRRAEGTPVVAAFEGEHQALAVGGVTHHFQGVFDGLRTADVEVHTTVEAEFFLGVDRDHFRQLDLAFVQVLAGDLRQGVDLLFQRVVQARVGVAEVDRRVPHLQVEVGLVFGVPHIGAFATAENTWRLDVVDGVAIGAVFGFFIQKDLVFGGSDTDIRHGGRVPDCQKRC
ncbi:hypothetical protein ALQ29_05598 [Pseudomonas marginalis pv. marginalis]|uniref:Uncharacterized protein n=1 Tax=Pseudomonas marginalis pv. marginalis TaxID=97473 RepID=A0A3M3WNY6_PSEMA|nr:hypothetical protein ALQ38_05566 [Pseudomonas marginalis pv. marginalis]RMP06560.1 hypothetical protein ALQ29_05598 [Pseudomonas marginalis pv. marginalis]